MTEYDFSPEAYQAHLANMHRISNWVGATEEHRPEFGNAAALVDNGHKPRRRSDNFSERRRPPPLPLPPHGAPPYGPDPGYGIGMGISPYPSPQHSASFDMGFAYANGPGSPGPMPPHMHMHPGHSPHHPSFGPMMSQPPSPPHYEHSSHPRRSRSSSFSFAPPPGPNSFFPFMGMGGPPGYAQGPGYVILPPTPSRHTRRKHRGGPSISYVYV